MKALDLKPCPFCGGEAYIRKENIPYHPTLYAVDCGNDRCDVDPSTDFFEDKAKAIEAWNRRADDENA